MIDSTILDNFDGRAVLVTGGTGMIGRQIVNILSDAGATVTSASLDDIEIHPAARHLKADLTDFQTCKRITEGMDFVFHVAGIKGSIEVTKSKPASFFVPLLMMNTNMLEASRINGVLKVLYTSSVGAYHNAEVFKESDDSEDKPPMDMFPGWAKRMAEYQVKAYKIQYGLENFAIVRPCNVYGPGDNFDPENAMVIPSLMHRIRRGDDPLVVWGDGSAIRDFAFSVDIAEGVILAIHHGTGGEFVNLGSGSGYSIKELVEAMNSFIPFKYEFDTSKPSGFPKRVMDLELAEEKIGYYPSTSLEDGLKKTWDWYLENENEHLRKVNYFNE